MVCRDFNVMMQQGSISGNINMDANSVQQLRTAYMIYAEEHKVTALCAPTTVLTLVPSIFQVEITNAMANVDRPYDSNLHKTFCVG